MECIGQDSQRSRAKPMEHQQILRSVLGEVFKLGHSDGCERPRCWRANLGQTHEQHATGCEGHQTPGSLEPTWPTGSGRSLLGRTTGMFTRLPSEHARAPGTDLLHGELGEHASGEVGRRVLRRRSVTCPTHR